ncbi:myb-like DNA-binding protein bas1 [Coemansia sp. RSA 1813]|nr:myb-like DNA-binding protein bas1 [Coemansia sp. RSA 1843]KAJ2093431.1 myb-like DNA-binding protein bas1 [Coemansia sp. RSA 986]KAJ2217239.1 myb-like DNA-binding protein bas1 [Coemansia sp. RSA 487]KAJ2572439.1 myb-like DNA-binding protein bas1 [Coemansia sp. RSA 1813]
MATHHHHHHAPVPQASLSPHSPSSLSSNNEHTLYFAHNVSRDAEMYFHASGAGNETRKRIGSDFSADRYNGGGPFPNQAEINAMDVAELRQMVSYLVCNHRSARSPTPTSSAADAPPSNHFCSPTSPTFSSSSSYASASSLSASAAFRRTPVRTQQSGTAPYDASNTDNHVRKRVRHDSEASATHRMGIDLLLNASTISDKIDDYSRRPSSPSGRNTADSTCRAELSPVASEQGSWRGSFRPPRLPPISHLEAPRDAEHRPQDMSSSLPSPGYGSQSLSLPTDSFTAGPAGSASSLNAYRLSSTSARGGRGSGSHSQHFPPPLSTTRSQPGICQNPSPPESDHSSPNGITPAEKMYHSSSYPSNAGLSQIPSLDASPLPPLGNDVVCSDISRRHPYTATPATPSMHPSQQPMFIPQQQQQQQSSPQMQRNPGFSFHQAPVLHHGPPTSQRNLYMQAQGYFSHQLPPPHSGPAHSLAPPPMHLQHALPGQHAAPVSMHGHMARPQHQAHNPEPIPMARNVSKPKFNYAFLDTKRPRGPSSRWTPEEDELLKRAVKQFGEDRQWVKVAQQVPGRSNLQCRQRWLCNIKAQVEKERSATVAASEAMTNTLSAK